MQCVEAILMFPNLQLLSTYWFSIVQVQVYKYMLHTCNMHNLCTHCCSSPWSRFQASFHPARWKFWRVRGVQYLGGKINARCSHKDKGSMICFKVFLFGGEDMSTCDSRMLQHESVFASLTRKSFRELPCRHALRTPQHVAFWCGATSFCKGLNQKSLQHLLKLAQGQFAHGARWPGALHLFSEMQRHGPQPNLITYNATGLLLAEVLSGKDSDCRWSLTFKWNFRGGGRRWC